MVEAKFFVQSVEMAKEGVSYNTVRLAPVYSQDPNDVNKAFSDATPSGSIVMNIQVGKPAIEQFKEGDLFFVNFVKDLSPLNQGEAPAESGSTSEESEA